MLRIPWQPAAVACAGRTARALYPSGAIAVATGHIADASTGSSASRGAGRPRRGSGTPYGRRAPSIAASGAARLTGRGLRCTDAAVAGGHSASTAAGACIACCRRPTAVGVRSGVRDQAGLPGRGAADRRGPLAAAPQMLCRQAGIQNLRSRAV